MATPLFRTLPARPTRCALSTNHPLLTTPHCLLLRVCVCRLKDQKGGFLNSDIKVRHGILPARQYVFVIVHWLARPLLPVSFPQGP